MNAMPGYAMSMQLRITVELIAIPEYKVTFLNKFGYFTGSYFNARVQVVLMFQLIPLCPAERDAVSMQIMFIALHFQWYTKQK